MSRVLTVNPGSSSLKVSVVDSGETIGEWAVQDWDGLPDPAAVEEVGPVDAVALRFVHGGDRPGPVVLDAKQEESLRTLVPMAPIHQPRSLLLGRALRTWWPDTPLVACFDTSFHTRLPPAASTYPIPMEWTRKYGVRRYGFHGLSCANALRTTAETLGRRPEGVAMICCHLGSGVSVTAIDGGRSVDTSMGFTPLDGVPMATRPGALDPGLLLYLAREIPLQTLDNALNHHSGLAGLSGTTGDLREVLAVREQGCPEADLAVRVYLHRLRREIAAARTSLPRLDALVLTGGVAEHQPGLLDELAAGLEFLGVEPTVTPAREDLEMARQTEETLN
ncbi:acetate/propionate family kinase [Kutzneria sp. CA-103260]|uniref:acetate/propionate family kinase n=1 Tax=Kutzneria sp. CA-103260 TaxID=2802641 RepID=UPI001BA603B1|nr:acetate kinase [Kutzneria sp. CA-103260]QUQ64034.1 acetate kinase [Kutzneria sp. CA-103260]